MPWVFYQGPFFVERLLFLVVLCLAVLAWWFSSTARALIVQGQFNCVVVLLMFVCSSSGGFQTFRKNLGIPRTVGGAAFAHEQCLVARPCVKWFELLVLLSPSRLGLVEWLLYLDVPGAAAMPVAFFCTVYLSISKCVLVLM